MWQAEIFSGDALQVKKDFNEWLDRMQKANEHSPLEMKMTQSPNGFDGIAITILYRFRRT